MSLMRDTDARHTNCGPDETSLRSAVTMSGKERSANGRGITSSSSATGSFVGRRTFVHTSSTSKSKALLEGASKRDPCKVAGDAYRARLAAVGLGARTSAGGNMGWKSENYQQDHAGIHRYLPRGACGAMPMNISRATRSDAPGMHCWPIWSRIPWEIVEPNRSTNRSQYHLPCGPCSLK